MRAREVLKIVTALAREADGYDADEISKAQESALDYYFMRERGDEVPGRSRVVSGDVSAMVEANAAQMMPSLTAKRVVDLDADSTEDEEQAETETRATSRLVMGRRGGWLKLLEGVKDALLSRNCYAKVWVEERVRTRIRNYSDVAPEAMAEIALSSEVLSYTRSTGKLRVRERDVTRELEWRTVPVENFIYTKNWHSLDLQDIPFCGEIHIDLRTTLKEQFPDMAAKIDELPGYADHKVSQAARNPRKRVHRPNPTSDPALDEIEWIESYALLDTDGDGIAERRRVCFVESKLVLENVDVPLVEYAAGSALINPHRLLGVSIYDKLKQTQDIGTGLKRSAMDNANAANKSRTAYLKGIVDNDDLSDGAVNADIGVEGVADVRQAITALGMQDVTLGILKHIEANNRSRAELGGAALDMAQANLQIGDRVGSEGVDRAYSVMEQLATMMMRTVAESFLKNVHLLAHEVLRLNFDEPITVPMGGKGDYLTVTPSEWKRREYATVRLGMSPGEKRQQRSALGFVLDAQIKLADKGYSDILVNLEGFYAALMDWCRASDLERPEQYWIDPRSDDAKQAADDLKASRAQERAAQQKLTDVALSLEQLRISLGKYEGDADRALKWAIEQLGAEIEEMKVVGKATADLELQKSKTADEAATQEGREAELETVKGLVDELKELDGGDDGAAE